MIRAVLFDLDDTLVDFPRPPGDARAVFDAGAQRVYAFLTARGCSLPTFEQFLRQQHRIARTIRWTTRLTRGETDGRRFLRRLCRDYRLQRDEGSLAILGWLWYEPIAETAEMSADVIPTLEALRAADLQLGLVVNTPLMGAVIDQHLSRLGLLEFFPVRAYSSEIGFRKPDRRLFATALSELGVSPDEVAFVGNDPQTDVRGARRAGLTTLLKSAAPQSRGRHQAHHVIGRIGEILDVLAIPSTTTASIRLEPLSVPPLKVNEVVTMK